MKVSKNIIIWNYGIDNLIKKDGLVGGLTVQMYFWSRVFLRNGWNVYSLTTQKPFINEISFLNIPKIPIIGIFIEVLYCFLFLYKYKPRLVMTRGASRSLFYLSFFCEMLGIKLVLFGASDSDFSLGNELIKAKHDRTLFRKGLKKIKYIVFQNDAQLNSFQDNYARYDVKHIIIPNIWESISLSTINEQLGKKDYFLWVGNFRDLKRPEWFFEMAKNYPLETFIMVGGPIDYNLFNKCMDEAEDIDNLIFMGEMSFFDVNNLFSSAKALVCTSKIEGFPNTFLQAWSNNIPVLTTFDPSGIVQMNSLGIVVENLAELLISVNMFNKKNEYIKFKENIYSYFEERHNSNANYKSLTEFLEIL